MFKKPFGNRKTSAPLRSSDRLKQSIAEKYELSKEDAEIIVPDGLESIKFENNQGKPGVAYLSPDGDPLWFTIGKGSEDLIPTVYTLWKKPDLLPTLTTHAPVILRIQEGADLMIPGVVSWPSPLTPNQLVSISKHLPDRRKRSHPFAVGRIGAGVDDLKLGQDGAKGKAVIVWHSWNDKLWEIGRGGEMPSDVEMIEGNMEHANVVVDEGQATTPTPTHTETDVPRLGDEQARTQLAEDAEPESNVPTQLSLTAEDITDVLRTALLLSLSDPPPAGAFPVPATTFYTTYILPYRPAYLSSSSPPADIKHSSLKSLSAFLKSMEKSGLVTLKNQKGNILVTSTNAVHPDIRGVGKYRTIKDEEEKEKRRKDREEEERSKRPQKEVEVRVYYKPFGQTLGWFKEMGEEPSTEFLLPDLRQLLNTYITSHNLINIHQQQFVNVSDDPSLTSAITGPVPGKRRGSEGEESVEFMKREDILKRLTERMQPWYEIRVDGKAGEKKKGVLPPVTLTMKSQQKKRKIVTVVTGLEPFAAVVGSAGDVAEEVSKSGFGASVSQLPNKPSAHEILMQGKQNKVVVDLLVGKGVPKKWIEVVDLTK